LWLVLGSSAVWGSIPFARFQPSHYGSISGIIFAIGLLGGMVALKIIGNLSVGASVQRSISVAVVMTEALPITSL